MKGLTRKFQPARVFLKYGASAVYLRVSILQAKHTYWFICPRSHAHGSLEKRIYLLYMRPFATEVESCPGLIYVSHSSNRLVSGDRLVAGIKML